MSDTSTYIVVRERSRSALSSMQLAATAHRSLTYSIEELRQKELAILRGHPGVVHVAEDMPIALFQPMASGSQPPAATPQRAWGIGAVGAEDGPWTGAGVTVAVLDTGIDTDHPAFAGKELRPENLHNFSTDPDMHDVLGHGTHCAATVMGADVNGTRIGVAPGITTALIGKVLNSSGRGNSGAIIRALLWAESRGARIICLSLGFDFTRMVEQLVERDLPHRAAVSRALEAYRANLGLFEAVVGRSFTELETIGGGALVIAAAGNESARDRQNPYDVTVMPPANVSTVLAVGALENTTPFKVAPFSNASVDLVAPGVDILSAVPGGGLASRSGTSMAAPHVCGVAALWAQSLRESGRRHLPSDVRERILNSAVPITSELGVHAGRGIVRAPQTS